MEKELMDFGGAIKSLKEGKCVARKGWNGKGMCIYLNKGSYPFNKKINDNDFNRTDGVSKDLFNLGDAGTVIRLPNINMKNSKGSTVTGWLASQTDILAEDWVIVE